MSKAHIKDTYESFRNLNGQCCILVATESAANVSLLPTPVSITQEHTQGIDVSDITQVILFGISENPMDHEQKGGHCGCSDDKECLVLLIVESWTFKEVAIVKQKHEHTTKVQ